MPAAAVIQTAADALVTCAQHCASVAANVYPSYGAFLRIDPSGAIWAAYALMAVRCEPLHLAIGRADPFGEHPSGQPGAFDPRCQQPVADRADPRCVIPQRPVMRGPCAGIAPAMADPREGHRQRIGRRRCESRQQRIGYVGTTWRSSSSRRSRDQSALAWTTHASVPPRPDFALLRAAQLTKKQGIKTRMLRRLGPRPFRRPAPGRAEV